MGDENLEDKVTDVDMRNALFAMDVTMNALLNREQYKEYQKMYWSWKRITGDYIYFRLTHYDSEARSVIREVYNVLGYNPYNPRQISGRGCDDDE